MTLTLESVGYRYAGSRTPAILDVDLELRTGEVLGVTGPAESGKSTLCLVASGLAPRSIGGLLRGTIRLDGEDVDRWPMHRLAGELGIGFQSPSAQLSQVAQTTFEEVAFGPMNLGVPVDEVISRTWDALDAMAVAHLAERDPRQLSGGQQQLVAIAGLLAMGTRHLLLDEPTAQLDPAGTRLVTDALATLAARGASILLVEQKPDVLASVANRTAVLAAGTVELIGPTAEILADERLTELGVGAPSDVRLRRALHEAGVAPGAIEDALGHA